MQIFQPNNHSVWAITYRAVSDGKRDLVSVLVLKHYKSLADQVLSVAQVNEVEIASNNFRVGISKNHFESKILIRAYPQGSSDVLIKDVIGASKFLQEQGVSVPLVIHSDTEEPLTSYMGLNYVAFNFIEGNHFHGTDKELASASRGISQLFKTLTQLPTQFKLNEFEISQSKAGDFGFSKEVWSELFSVIKREHSGKPDEISALLLENEGLIFESVDEVEVLPHSPVQIVHNDLHPHNLITDGDSLRAVIDMDSLCPWERMKAITFALHRLVRECIVQQKPVNVATAVERGKSLFLNEYLTTNTLTEEEIQGLKTFIVHEALRRMTGVVKDLYMNGDGSWKQDVKKNISSILESKYF